MTTEKTGNGNLSQRIATNSMLLFVRMLFITIINLYSVRFVLAGLGAIDYGIFNAVAGVVMMSSFLSGVMELSIQRHVNSFLVRAFGVFTEGANGGRLTQKVAAVPWPFPST